MSQTCNLSRVSRQYPCPICGKTDWCAYNQKIAICMRIQSPYPTKNGGWKHYLNGNYEVPPQTHTPTRNARSNDVTLHYVYKELLAILPLKESHRQHLLARGMTPQEIKAGMYRSLPTYGRSEIIDRLVARTKTDILGVPLGGVPGFGYKNGRLIMTGPPGLIIPVISPNGLIVSLLIRPDRQKEGRKYVLLSSRWLEYGSSPGARLHLARPVKIKSDNVIWITEGPLKANISAYRLQARVLAVPGVSNWKSILSLALPPKIIVAYDAADYEKNYHVRHHARSLANSLIDRGHEVYAALWQGAKGLDDALVEGRSIKILPVPRHRKEGGRKECSITAS